VIRELAVCYAASFPDKLMQTKLSQSRPALTQNLCAKKLWLTKTLQYTLSHSRIQDLPISWRKGIECVTRLAEPKVSNDRSSDTRSGRPFSAWESWRFQAACRS
jgi:hypothetical protein